MKMNYWKAGTFTFACLFLFSFGYELNYWLRPGARGSDDRSDTGPISTDKTKNERRYAARYCHGKSV